MTNTNTTAPAHPASRTTIRAQECAEFGRFDHRPIGESVRVLSGRPHPDRTWSDDAWERIQGRTGTVVDISRCAGWDKIPREAPYLIAVDGVGGPPWWLSVLDLEPIAKAGA